MRLTPAQIKTIAREYPEEVVGSIEVRPADAVEVYNADALARCGSTPRLTIHADGTVVHKVIR